jgi:Effector Associated Constant Component 1
MDEQAFVIKFPDTSRDLANSYAEELQLELKEADNSATVQRPKDQKNAMDFGATLVLILGTGAVTALAKGLSSWIARNSGVRLVIETPDGKVLADHLDSKNASEIAASVFGRKAKIP